MTSVFFALCRQPVMHSPTSRQPRRRGPAPPKNGSSTSTPGSLRPSRPKNTPTGAMRNVCPHPHLLGHLLHDLVRRRHRRVGHHAQHPFRLVVVGCELGPPVGDVRPLAVVVEGVPRLVQRVGVHQRASADPRAGQDDHVPQQVDPLDAQAAEPRRPQEPAGVPGRPGKVGVLEPAPRLQHAHPVALLGEPQRGDRAAEARADHEHVIVVCRGRACPRPVHLRRPSSVHGGGPVHRANRAEGPSQPQTASSEVIRAPLGSRCRRSRSYTSLRCLSAPCARKPR